MRSLPPSPVHRIVVFVDFIILFIDIYINIVLLSF